MLKNAKIQLSEIRDLKIIRQELGEELKKITHSAIGRRKTRSSFFRLYIITVLSYALLLLRRFWSKKNTTKLAIAKWIRNYFRTYFLFRGVTKYKTKPFPTAPTHPMIILSTRLSPFEALFTYQLFDFPVLIPLLNGFEAFKMYPKFRFSPIGNHLKSISYPDITLNTAWPELKKLALSGHHVLIHINQDIHHPGLREATMIYDTLKDIVTDVDLKDHIYALNLDGFERYPRASAFSPIQVRCDLKSLDEVYGILMTDQLDEKLDKIASFFGIWKTGWVMKTPLDQK